MGRFDIDSNVDDVSGAFGGFAAQLGGPVTSAIGVVNKALLTLAANPIGAVIAVIGLAIAALTAGLSKLQPVVDTIDQAMAALGATFSFFVDTVGSWLGLGDAPSMSLLATARAAAQLERDVQAAAKAQVFLITASATLRAEQRALALQAADANLSTEERIAALTQAEEVTRRLFNLQRNQLDQEIANLAAQQALGNNTLEDDLELANLRARLIDLGAMESSQLMAFTAQRSGLQKADAAAAEAAVKAGEAAVERARVMEEMEATAAQNEIDRIREIRQQREIDLLIAGGATEEEVFQARLARAETEEETAQILHEAEVARIESLRTAEEVAEQGRLDALQMQMDAEDQAAADKMDLDAMAGELARAQDRATFDTLIGLLGAGSVAGKAVAVTQATIKGFEGVQNAYTTAQSSPITAVFPGYPFVQAGLAGVVAAANIQSILSVAPPPGLASGGGGGPTGPRVSVPRNISAMAAAPSTSTLPPLPEMQVAITPGSGPGSLPAAQRMNRRRDNRRVFGRNDG